VDPSLASLRDNPRFAAWLRSLDDSNGLLRAQVLAAEQSSELHADAGTAQKGNGTIPALTPNASR
jgi:hypothetical protein